ncbi:26S protease regulatory subunit 8 [Entophlyctis sp. JEL0112]|nr:26S protease regulatory subunit 8 [Entophlyctis sp. JEL0112]
MSVSSSAVNASPVASAKASGDGIRTYYKNKLEVGSSIRIPIRLSHPVPDLETTISQRTQNLRRLEAQRNALNSKVRLLRDELKLLQEPGSYVGEVVKLMGKDKVLVKTQQEGKYVVDIAKSINIAELTPTVRVALRHDNYQLHKILPNKIDPLVSLMMVEKVPDSTYDQVGGLDRQIKEIKEVIELPVKHPELFESLGIAQPKGVLLYGPPGTGKTLLARAVAHHTDCKFIRVSGSELVQKYIGEGSRMVRELFVMAREHAPSIIFMDEIDSIGSSRGDGGGTGGDSEVQRTMLELLNQLDGFEATQSIKVIMATNRIDILDSALLRPGRIDRKIEFPPPNEVARTDILKIHSRKMNLTRGINLRKIAESLVGASGAEVKGVCTEAGMYALRERRVHVTQEDFEMAVGKIMKKDSEQNMSIKKLFNLFGALGFSSVLSATADFDTESYRPRTRETKASYELLLSLIHSQMGGAIPIEVLQGAAYDALVSQRRVAERHFGSTGVGNSTVDNGEGDTRMEREMQSIDQECGVAVVFDEVDCRFSWLRQVPRLALEMIENLKQKGVTSVTDLLEMEDADRNEALNGLSKHEGVKRVTQGESVVMQVRLDRVSDEDENEEEKQLPPDVGPVVAPFFPIKKDEGWWVVVGQKSTICFGNRENYSSATGILEAGLRGTSSTGRWRQRGIESEGDEEEGSHVEMDHND